MPRDGTRAERAFREFPYSAIILATCGVILGGMGLYFVLVRPPFLDEDAHYAGASLTQLQAVAPGLSRWLTRVFWVLGGYVVATGVLTVYLATTSVRMRRPGAGVVVTIAGVVSIGVMAVVNVMIDSAFKWPLVGIAALWALALVLYWRGR